MYAKIDAIIEDFGRLKYGYWLQWEWGEQKKDQTKVKLSEALPLRAFLCVQTEDDEGHQWQKSLYKKISKKGNESSEMSSDFAITRVLAMSKVLYGLHLVSTTLLQSFHFIDSFIVLLLESDFSNSPDLLQLFSSLHQNITYSFSFVHQHSFLFSKLTQEFLLSVLHFFSFL